MTTTTPASSCAHCSAVLVAAKSRKEGRCAGCAAERRPVLTPDRDDDARTTAQLGEHHGTAQLVHAPGCPGPRLTRHDGTRHAQLTCSACGAFAIVRRRVEWTDDPR